MEQAFRTVKSLDLRVQPVHHYLEWHLGQASKPVLLDDEFPGHRAGDSPVAPAARSPQALPKAQRCERACGLPIHSYATLLAELGTLTRNTVRIPTLVEVPPPHRDDCIGAATQSRRNASALRCCGTFRPAAARRFLLRMRFDG